MKKWLGFAMLAGILAACQESENISEFTGNETIYALQQASQYAISGTVTLKERRWKDNPCCSTHRNRGNEQLSSTSSSRGSFYASGRCSSAS